MKNKKLFAILTLVCFMMTLMPVAAFAAPYGSIDEQYTVVKTGDEVKVNVTEAGTYYVYAVKDGELAKVVGTDAAHTTGTAIGISVVKDTVAADGDISVYFTKAGEYTVGVAKAESALVGVVEGTTLVAPATVLANLDTFAIDMLNDKVSVDRAAVPYQFTFVTSRGAVKATNGFDKQTFTYNLSTNTTPSNPVPGAEVTIVTDSHAINVVKVDSVTKANGNFTFYVTGSIPGSYNVYLKHPAVATATQIPITVSAATIDEVTTLAQPDAPQDVDTVTTVDSGMIFNIADATGYAYSAGLTDATHYEVNCLEAPKGFNKSQDFELRYNVSGSSTRGWEITNAGGTGIRLDKEGTYTFVVSLPNGSKATASVTTAKFDTAVALAFANVPATVTYDKGTLTVDPTTDVYEVDANGVERLARGTVVITANGKAVTRFAGTTLTIDSDEKHIGSKITLLAKQGNLVTTHEITITETASAIVYANTEVPVGASKVLAGKVYDEEGKFVAANGNASVIVVEKPENAIASVSVVPGTPNSVNNGKFAVNFLANVPGEYKIQTIVNVTGGKYFTDFATITVGAAEGSFKDVIVLSIGSNNMIKNGSVDALLAAPEIKDGRTMIPMRAGLEAFGAKVDWDEANSTVTAEMNGVKVVMTVGSLDYTVNGKAMKADSAPYIKNGSTMVPAVFFTNAFGIVATPLYDANGVCDVLFSK